MSNTSIKNAFERMWQHVNLVISSKANKTDVAPAGYGLGTYAVKKNWSDIDSLDLNGTYDISIPQTHSLYTVYGILYGYVQVIGLNQSIASQILYPKYDVSCSLIRHKSAGKWGEWEWVNPPMVPGVEYRTTKRNNGNVIYTKLVNFSALPNNAEKGVIAMPANSRLISAVGYAEGASYNVLIPGYYGIKSIGSTRSSGNLWLSTSIDMSSYNGWITIEYTKEGG